MLIQHLGSSANVVFDCSQVEDADISIVQVLLSARATADRLGTTLHLRNPSPALLAVMERAGVAGVADDPFWTGDAP